MNRDTKQLLSEKIWKAIGATEEFLTIKYKPGYTPRQIMEIRGSFIYFTFLLSITLIAAIFQVIADVIHTAITIPLIINMAASSIAFINYRRKKSLQYTGSGEWIAAFLFTASIVTARYIYAILIGWEPSLSSYNLSLLFISSGISCILLYNRRLYRILFLFILTNWIIFLVAAMLFETSMQLQPIINGSQPAGFNILKEIFLIMIYVFLLLAVYMNLPIIDAYEKRSAQQQKTISDYNKFLSLEVDMKTKELRSELRERKNTEESLRVLSEAVKFSPISISITDTGGSIVYTNPWFESVTGYSLDEIRGKNPGPLLNKNLTKEERMAIYKTVMAGGEWRGELKNIKKNGEEFWDRVAISSIKDSNNRITHYVSIQEDITARKKTEEDLAESESSLRERNRAIEKDISIAEIVQKTLLRYEPSADTGFIIEYRQKCVEKIGGDFFAIKTPSAGELGVFIGDVSGHGVASALFTSLIKFITDELFARHLSDPSEYMRILNTALSGYMTTYFLTGIYAYLKHDSATGSCRCLFSTGGHPSPVLVKAGGEVEVVESQGPLIGLNENARYKCRSLELGPGDRLFLFTDGVPETTDHVTGNIIGFDQRLMKLFSDSRCDKTGRFLDSLLQNLDAIRGTDITEDDLLIIGIEIP